MVDSCPLRATRGSFKVHRQANRGRAAVVRPSVGRVAEGKTTQMRGAAVALITVVSAAILCVLVPLFVVTVTPPIREGAPWQIALVIMVFAGGALAHLLGSGRPYLYSVSAWLFVYLFLGIAPLVQVRLGVSPETTPDVAAQTIEPALIAVLLGVGGMAAGMAIASTRTPRPGRDRPVSTARLYVLVCVTVVFEILFVSSTGIGPYFESRFALDGARAAAWPDSAMLGLLAGASLALPLVSIHALVQLRRQRRAEGCKPGHALMLTTMLVLLLTTVNFVSSSRIILGTALLSLAILAGATASRWRTRVTFAMLIMTMVLIFPMADANRDGSTVQGPSMSDLAASGDYDAFAQITNAVLYVDTVGPTRGRQALGVAFFWVPRSIWADKPIDTGILLGDFRGYGFTNLSAPLWAEAYINVGLAGVPVVLALFGYALRVGDRRIAELGRPGAARIAGAILPFYTLIVLRGSLLQAMGALVALVAAIWFVGENSTRSAAFGRPGGREVLPSRGYVPAHER
jgi:hypothetical protein